MEKTRNLKIGIASIAIMVLWPGLCVQAGITNGGFDQGPDGLQGWTVVSGESQIYAEFGVGKMAEEDGVASRAVFYQTFDVLPEDQELTFDLQIMSAYSNETDHFNAYLYDGEWSETSGYTPFYSWSSNTNPVTISDSVSLNMQNINSSRASLIFELLTDGNQNISPMTVVQLDNVRTGLSTATTVPVPSAVLLAALGVGLVTGYQRRTSKKS